MRPRSVGFGGRFVALKRPVVAHIDEPRPRLASSTSPFRTDAPRSGFGCEFCGRFTLQHDMQHMAGKLRRVGRVRTPVCKDDRADRHHRPNLDQTWMKRQCRSVNRNCCLGIWNLYFVFQFPNRRARRVSWILHGDIWILKSVQVPKTGARRGIWILDGPRRFLETGNCSPLCF